jgi:3-oxoacyl-[acyl-carrier-protein] synthase II
VLERREAAEARGARIYAELCGFGKSNDAHHYAAPDPKGQGAARAMRQALDDADVAPESVDHINLHATSTPAGDPVETAAVKHVFGDHAHAISCSATKSMTGHLLGAAGAIEAVATVLAVVNDEVPPTINTETLDEGCDLDYTLHESKQRPVNVALANAFGFGGHNTTLAFRKVEG